MDDAKTGKKMKKKKKQHQHQHQAKESLMKKDEGELYYKMLTGVE